MNTACWLIICSLFITVGITGKTARANNPDYEQRRTAYIDSALANFSDDAVTLQAYRGLPVDTQALHDLLAAVPVKSTSDFDIVKLIRILFFTNGTYDAQILPVLTSVPFWLTKGDTLRVYWSENHMIMWMSSHWLLHERYGWSMDSSLSSRLRHYLRLKIQYGFYEFFSSTYAPYTLSGLLNLTDFAQDTEVKNLATQAATRLLKELLMPVNDKGVFYPAAGRNYYSKYEDPYHQNHHHLVYLLTGLGQPPVGASHSGGFLASSSIPVDSIIASWSPVLDTVYSIGHSLDNALVIHQSQTTLDRIIFQWSAGAYFHPLVALESVNLIVDSNLWNHVDFTEFVRFSGIPPAQAPLIAELASSISKSSVISGQDVAIFKSHSVTLSSVQDFWIGKAGYQQFPCVAAIGTTAVMTASGTVMPVWTDRPSIRANDHLPYVKQDKNVALIMYRYEKALNFFGLDNPEVALHWNAADFDETLNDGLWLLGRQGNAYVAVRRGCPGQINGEIACARPDAQAWAIIVGDSSMYGSFSNFADIISQSYFEETWYVDTANLKSVFYSKIIVDSTTIDYAWAVDTSLTSGLPDLEPAANNLKIFPNPAGNQIIVDVASLGNHAPVSIWIFSLDGQLIYFKKLEPLTQLVTLDLAGWEQGIYWIVAENGQQRHTGKLFKSF